MNSGTILVTGASGFVGWNILRYFAGKGKTVTGTYNARLPETAVACRWMQLPLESNGVARRIGDERPAAVIHCAAMPGIAECEHDRVRAFRINVDATSRVAEAAERLKIPLIYISTDLVFDGRRGWYSEEDLPNPPTYYGETKLLGEQEALGICERAAVVRLALVYGMTFDGFGGFLRWTFRSLLEGKTLSLYENQYRTALYAGDIPRIAEALLTGTHRGIYHAAGPNRMNRVEIGKQFAEQFGERGDCIEPARLERARELGQIDDTSLLTNKLKNATGIVPVGFSAGMQRLRAEYAAAGQHSG